MLIEVARERMGVAIRSASVWAYQRGRTLATADFFLRGKTSPPVVPITLGEPANQWTVTVLGADDQPIAGLRLAPRMLSGTIGRQATLWDVPDALLELLTATTDAKGVAKLTYLPEAMAPRSIRVGGSGVATHTLKVDAPKGKDVILKLGRAGRMVGVVRTASGQPLADVPVDVWVRGSGTASFSVRINQRATPDAVVRLDPHPLRTGPQGAFQTPPVLLNGSTYRVSIRHDGFVPFVSDWVTLDGERAAIPAIRLRPLVRLTGQIKDRQGHAVAGARIYLPGGSPKTAADGEGRFELTGVHPGKTVVLVEHPGFRLQGWLVDRSAAVDLGALTVVRESESPGSVMRPQADPTAPANARILADRLLEPFVQDAVENHDEGAQLSAISAFGEFDVDRALELLRNGKYREETRQYQSTREMLAAKLAVTEPARAEALVDSISDPLTKVSAWAGVAKAFPASERVRKQALLERATAQRTRLEPRRRWIARSGRSIGCGNRDRAPNRSPLWAGLSFTRPTPPP